MAPGSTGTPGGRRPPADPRPPSCCQPAFPHLNSTLLPHPPPTAPPRQLVTATLVVVAIHALLLLGLPQLGRMTRAGQDAGTFVTRLIAPPSADAVPAPIAAAPPPQVTAPPRPRPPPTRTEAQAPAVDSGAATPPPEPAQAANASETPGRAAPAVSQLGPRPAGAAFGGQSAPVPIEPPTTAQVAATALEFAPQSGDAPVRVPRAAELSYRAVGRIGEQDFELPTTLHWRQDGHLYEIRWTLYSPRIGEQTRYAVGLLSPHGLVPIRAELRTPDIKDMRFDYARQRVSLGAIDAEAAVAAGTQDRLGVLIQLGALLAGDPDRYPAGRAIELPAVHPTGTGRWRFVVEADEALPALKGRSLPTVRLVHAAQDAGDARIELWLGRTLDYLPVRVRITEANGDAVQYDVVTAWAQPTPVAAALPERAPAPPTGSN